MSTAAPTGARTTGRGVGESALRPDGGPKVRGEFAFSNDLWAEGMLWGRTLRSPHPRARITSIDVGEAAALPGVRAIVTADDVPGSRLCGLEHADQPVFAWDEVSCVGEPIAAVAADHPETARLACQLIRVTYDVLDPVLDAEAVAAGRAATGHPDGDLYRHLLVARGDLDASGPIVVEGTYEVGMQDQAFLGPEAGLATPTEDGGVELAIATQWLHSDQRQVAACLDLPEGKVRFTLAGVGGAFGGREDVSLHVHCCLLAQLTGRPVKMAYGREESFLGHVHRHPGRIWIRHTADSDGRLRTVEARVVLDGGAFRSSSFHVITNAVCFVAGPYVVPAVRAEGFCVRTNNPSCGAMRGFGAVQVAVAHEAQMDKLAVACGLGPVEVRRRNALHHGGELLTGQRIEGRLPVARCLDELDRLPMPPAMNDEPLSWPGGAGRTANAEHMVRGVGYAVGFKNLMYAEGYDDGSVAWCHLEGDLATIRCAAAEVGQGFVTLCEQIARTVLGVEKVLVLAADTGIGSAGSTSASRQTWMSGGAVDAACREVAAAVAGAWGAARRLAPTNLVVSDGRITAVDGSVELGVVDAAAELCRSFEAQAPFHHKHTSPLDEHGQGEAHVAFACAAMRAVVDVDPELGLVRVVQLATAQDVGKALNPVQVLGQIEGGAAQGLGLAVMEELIVEGGRIRNPSFTDYLIPTALDTPAVLATLVEEAEPGAPFGAKGVGEPPTIVAAPAIVAALRAATGRALTRVPVRPADLCGVPPSPAC